MGLSKSNFDSIVLSLLDLPSIQSYSASIQDILLSLAQHNPQLCDSLLSKILTVESHSSALASFAGRLCSLRVKDTPFGKHLNTLRYRL